MKSFGFSNRAFALSALALSLAAGQAIAGGVQEWQITFDIDSGALAGQSFTGTLSYDQAVLNANFTDGVLSAADGDFSFSVTLPNGVTLTLADDPGALAYFQGFELVGLNYLGDNFADAALSTFDVANDINNTFEVFTDFDFEPDGFGTFSFERLTSTDAQTATFDWTNTDIDDTDISSTPTDGDEIDEDTNFEGELSVSVDLDDGSPGSFNPRHVLIRFNDIIGAGAGQIPAGSTILGAVFRVEIISPGSGFTAHRLLTDWDVDTITWNMFNGNGEGGVQADDADAVSIPDDQRLGVGGTVLAVDLTPSLQAFADGATNHGFALLPVAEGTDGVDFWTSEAPIGVPLAFFPPLLVVELADGTTRTFQEDVNGYEGTADTTLNEGQPDVNFGSLNTTSIDLSDGGFVGQYLLRFDGLFGTDPDQINPATDVIESATLTVRSTSPGEDVSVYELNFEFDEARDTWNEVVDGITPDQVIEPFLAVSVPGETAGFSGGGMTVDNPGTTGLGTPTGIGVEDQFDAAPGPEAGFLLISRDTLGSFAVRSTDVDIAAYAGFDSIEFYLRDVGTANALEIRVGVGNDSNFWVSNDGFIPGAGWSQASVDLTDSSKWTQVIGSGTFADAIASADRLQFRHETMPILDGQNADDATGDFGIDRLTFCSKSEVRCPTVTTISTRFVAENPAYSTDIDGDVFIAFDLTSSLQRFADDPSSNLGWAFLPESTNGFDFDAEGTLQPPAGPQLFVSFLPPAGCNNADLVAPFGVLDLADISAFISAFTTNDPSVDFDENGIFDLADITAFTSAFIAGCP